MGYIHIKQKNSEGFFDYYEIRKHNFIIKLNVESKTLSALSQFIIKSNCELITEIEYDEAYRLSGL